jgi:hypothetical protein
MGRIALHGSLLLWKLISQERAIMEGLPFHGGKLDDISVIVARTALAHP